MTQASGAGRGDPPAPFFERLLTWIGRVNGAVATACFLALTAVVAMQVFTRFVLHSPVLWSEEVARFLFFWTALLGAALSVRQRRHFVIDVRMGAAQGPMGPVGRVLALLPDLAIIAFAVFLVVEGISYAQIGAFRTGTNSRVNMALVYAAIPTFAALTTLYAAGNLLDDFRRDRDIARNPPPAD
ncbi:TRAP-type C4-dicarboxylate transport system permease small subunit [Palleronia aestuarii]|uniref:TRAP transporter small permease protein n=1 Tax=Palleronia aestuarii TaxID=568105 RepID=A0A2W7NB35_9RHOB|nr:TRAP transporter small permease [Palleronia aestuarii]PZX17200.1 TRAP-type C4-dicarboxylate transport system permease small subunit [Palleronia aestuarii]